jgi:acetyl-CoA carboxylase biotin carboxyl carrier protein
MANEKPDNIPIDTRLIRKLADILGDTGLTEIEIERGDLKIKISRTVQAAPAAPAQVQAYQALPAQAPQPIAISGPQVASAPAVEPAAVASPRGDLVKSPMVGTVYLQAQPGQPPFVKPGDRVEAGQTLLIIEAMKTMNPIAAPKAGTIVEVLVEDAQPVEFGEPLVAIE